MSYVGVQYAEALFGMANEERQLTLVEQAYNEFLAALDGDLNKFLTHPKVSKQDKKDVLKNVVSNTVFLHFLYVLLDNSRIDLVTDCHEEFNRIINNQNKIMDVQVHSQKALSPEELDRLKASIGQKHNRTVVIENIVNPKIIGGLRIEYEGHVLDQTINHYLHALKHDLTK